MGVGERKEEFTPIKVINNNMLATCGQFVDKFLRGEGHHYP